MYQILYIYCTKILMILFNLGCTIDHCPNPVFLLCSNYLWTPLSTSPSLYLSVFTFYSQGGKSSSRKTLRTGRMTSGFLRRPGSMSLTQGLETDPTPSQHQELPGSKVVLTHLWNTPLKLYQQAVRGIPILLGEPRIAWCVL